MIDFYKLKWKELIWVALLAGLTGLLAFIQGVDPNNSGEAKALVIAGILAFARPALAAVWNLIVKAQQVVTGTGDGNLPYPDMPR